MNPTAIQTAPLVGSPLEPLDALRASAGSSPRGDPASVDPSLAPGPTNSALASHLPPNSSHRQLHRMSPLEHETGSFPQQNPSLNSQQNPSLNPSLSASMLPFQESQLKISESVHKIEHDVSSMGQDLAYFRHMLDFQNSKIEKLTSLLIDLLHNKDVSAIVTSLQEIQTSGPFGVDDPPEGVSDSLSDPVHDSAMASLQPQGVLSGDMDRQIHQVAQAAVRAQAKPDSKRKPRYKENNSLRNHLSTSLQSQLQSLQGSNLSNQALSQRLPKTLQNQGIQEGIQEGISNQSLRNQSIQNQGIQNQSIQNQGIQNQGIQNQGIQNQGIQNRNIQNQGINRGIQNQSIQNQSIQNSTQNQPLRNSPLQHQQLQSHRNHQNKSNDLDQSPPPLSHHHIQSHPDNSPRMLDQQLQEQSIQDELGHSSGPQQAQVKPDDDQDLSTDEKDMSVVSMPGLEVVNINDIGGRKRPKVEIDFLHNPMTVKEIYDEFTKGFRGQPPLREMDERFGKHQWRGDSRSKESKRFQRRKKLCDAIERGMEKYGKSQEEIMNYIEEFRGDKSLTWVMNGHLPNDLLE